LTIHYLPLLASDLFDEFIPIDPGLKDYLCHGLPAFLRGCSRFLKDAQRKLKDPVLNLYDPGDFRWAWIVLEYGGKSSPERITDL
jgi:hypothetical protein